MFLLFYNFFKWDSFHQSQGKMTIGPTDSPLLSAYNIYKACVGFPFAQVARPRPQIGPPAGLSLWGGVRIIKKKTNEKSLCVGKRGASLKVRKKILTSLCYWVHSLCLKHFFVLPFFKSTYRVNVHRNSLIQNAGHLLKRWILPFDKNRIQ